MTKRNTKNNNIFKNDNFKSIPSTFYTASHMQYVSKTGEEITVPVSSDLKLLYGFLFDQCRSFEAQNSVDGEGQDLYQDWDIIFRVIGRRYTGDKTSIKLVKLLEDAGILVQTKRPNSTSTVKFVFDITTIQNIKFSNPELDKWKQEQKQRRADRAAAYATAKTEKIAAIEAAKQQHTIKPAAAEEGTNVIRSKAQIIDVETANVSNSKGYRDSEVEDDFLVDCAVSRDADFEGYAEQYQEPTKQPPKPVTSVARTGKVGDCKKCKSCESDPWGSWYCNNDGCENSEPPF